MRYRSVFIIYYLIIYYSNVFTRPDRVCLPKWQFRTSQAPKRRTLRMPPKIDAPRAWTSEVRSFLNFFIGVDSRAISFRMFTSLDPNGSNEVMVGISVTWRRTGSLWEFVQLHFISAFPAQMCQKILFKVLKKIWSWSLLYWRLGTWYWMHRWFPWLCFFFRNNMKLLWYQLLLLQADSRSVSLRMLRKSAQKIRWFLCIFCTFAIVLRRPNRNTCSPNNFPVT